MEKSRHSRAIQGEEIRRNNQSKTFSPTGVASIFSVPEGVMAIEVPQNEEISGGEKNGGRKGVGFAIRRRRSNRGSINIME